MNHEGRLLAMGAALLVCTGSLACTDDGPGDDEIGEIGEIGEVGAQTDSEESSGPTDTETSESGESTGGSESSETETDTESSSSEESSTETETGAETESETESDSDTDSGSDTESDSGGMVSNEIEIVITSDNAYGFGYGTEAGLANYYGGIENTTAGQIFNCNGGPELYEIPAEAADNASFLYIITWADSSVTQGVIARFRKDGGLLGFGEDVLTGDEGWEVCATGVNYSPGSGGPSQAVIDEQILGCNGGNLDAATTSGGWVDEVGTALGAVAIGEDNTTPYDGGPQPGNEFPLVCQNVMPEEAHWMWFNWDPQNVIWPQTSPFLWPGGGQNPDHQFLIFRLAADLIPDPQ